MPAVDAAAVAGVAAWPRPEGRDLPQGARGVAGDRQRSPGGHQGVPVPVPQPALELHHSPQITAQSSGQRSVAAHLHLI